jgi:hypothetical protein
MNYIQPDNWSIIEGALIAKALNHLKAYLVLEMRTCRDNAPLRKAGSRNISRKLYYWYLYDKTKVGWWKMDIR